MIKIKIFILIQFDLKKIATYFLEEKNKIAKKTIRKFFFPQ